MNAKLGLFLVSCFGAPAAWAAPACVHPNSNNFLEHARLAIGATESYFPLPSARFFPLQFEGRSLQWMAASWEPSGGALFVLNCQGARIAALPLGRFERLRPGPTLAGLGQSLEIVYDLGVATGDNQRNVSLVTFSVGSIAALWTHEASELVALPSLRADYIDTFTWRYSANGATIQVTGKRAVGDFADREHGWSPHTLHMLPAEIFCWRPGQNSYTSCSRQ